MVYGPCYCFASWQRYACACCVCENSTWCNQTYCGKGLPTSSQVRFKNNSFYYFWWAECWLCSVFFYAYSPLYIELCLYSVLNFRAPLWSAGVVIFLATVLLNQ